MKSKTTARNPAPPTHVGDDLIKTGASTKGTADANACKAVDKLLHEAAVASNEPSRESSIEAIDEEAALAAPTANFANGQELAKAIAQKCDLVAVGSKLLRDGEAKGASVRARMFETTVEYLYGKPSAAATPEASRVVFICDIPRPRREKKAPK